MPSERPPFVSIVTPAYNEERYLKECIESVLAQTYSSWDYTIVDNASTDRTPDIAHDYAKRDPRIRVVRNPVTVPVRANLNIACRQIAPHAKYCKVVAGDDWIYPQCIELMVDHAEANPTVAIVGAYRAMGERLQAGGLPFGTTVAPGRQVCRSYLLGGPYPFGVPTSLLYRADIVRSREDFFDVVKPEADVNVCLEHLQNRDFGFVHQVLSFMRVQGNTSHAVVQANNLFYGEKLRSLLLFGPKYLDESEQKREIAELLRQYYEYLGTQVLKRRQPAFWTLHRDALAEVGYTLSMPRVYAHALVSIGEAAARRVRRWI